MKVRLLIMSILVIFTMICPPALALTADDILSKYQTPSRSTSLQSMIDRIIAPVPQDGGSPAELVITSRYPDCSEGDVCIGDRIEFIEAIPRTATGKFKKTALRERFVQKAA